VVKTISVLCWLLLLGTTFVVQEARDSTVRISQANANQNLTNRISPTYPALAKAARIQGDVRLEVFISKTGNVDSVKVVSGHPMLIPSAVEAVKKWQYKPFLVDDQPVDGWPRL
jgi:protein TonB